MHSKQKQEVSSENILLSCAGRITNTEEPYLCNAQCVNTISMNIIGTKKHILIYAADVERMAISKYLKYRYDVLALLDMRICANMYQID